VTTRFLQVAEDEKSFLSIDRMRRIVSLVIHGRKISSGMEPLFFAISGFFVMSGSIKYAAKLPA